MPHTWLEEVGDQDDKIKSVPQLLGPVPEPVLTERLSTVEESDAACIDDDQLGPCSSEDLVMRR